MEPFPVGKLPAELMEQVLRRTATGDPRLLLGPGVGLDCAVIEFGDRLLVAKSDPVTFSLDQIGRACSAVGATLVGGHPEITAGLQRPIVAGTMLGEVDRERLITPSGARPGDHLLLTKGIPLEATSLLAREVAHRLTALS